MAADAHPTRAKLLATGLALAESGGLANLSINAVVAAAGVAKGTFYVHFPTRDEYLAALHAAFHDDLEGRIDEATGATPAGAERLRRGVAAYLDGCLAQAGVKALLVEARAEPAIREQVRARNRAFVKPVLEAFAALGWPDAAVAARLYVAMVAEAALIELEAGRRQPAVRRALDHFLQRGG